MHVLPSSGQYYFHMGDVQFENPGYMTFGNGTYEEENEVFPQNLSTDVSPLQLNDVENGSIDNGHAEYDSLAYDNPAYSNGQLSFGGTSTFKS